MYGNVQLDITHWYALPHANAYSLMIKYYTLINNNTYVILYHTVYLFDLKKIVVFIKK